MRTTLFAFSIFIFLTLILFIQTAVFAGGSKIKNDPRTGLQSMKPGTPSSGSIQQAVERIGKTAGNAGVLVVSLPSGEVVCKSQPKGLFVSASLMKLLTSYTALKKLGPSFRFKTKLLAAQAPIDGVITGNVWIKGSGDPFFTSENALQLAREVREKGIRQIRGGILVDNSFFQPSSEHICLDDDCNDLYNPVVSAAAIDYNILTVKIALPAKKGKALKVDSSLAQDYARVNGHVNSTKNGSVRLRLCSLGAVGDGGEQFQLSGRTRAGQTREFRFNAADPGGLFAHAMRTALEHSGVMVTGTVAEEGHTPPGAETISYHESPPLAELIQGLNRYSNNFMAEMLLRSIGGYVEGAPGDSRKGLAVVRTALSEAGIPEEISSLDCGSGLSRFCRISPETFCRLLAAAWKDDGLREEFVSSLAVNGEQGTLRRRMLMPGLTVRGKTGTLKDVIGFAGYVSGPSGKTYAAAIILNEVQDRFKAREAVDLLLERIAFSD